jgi:hypothetical protein
MIHLLEMAGYDITCEGRIAFPRYMRFSYFDAKGDEYNASIEGIETDDSEWGDYEEEDDI